MGTIIEQKDYLKEFHLGVRIDVATNKKLEELALKDGRSKANYVRHLLQKHIAEEIKNGTI